MEYYFWPDLMILGGGVSKKSEKFLPLLTLQTEVVPAQMLNNAGIVGAALAAVPQGAVPVGGSNCLLSLSRRRARVGVKGGIQLARTTLKTGILDDGTVSHSPRHCRPA